MMMLAFFYRALQLPLIWRLVGPVHAVDGKRQLHGVENTC